MHLRPSLQHRTFTYRLAFLSLAFGAMAPSRAATHVVDTIEALSARIADAKAGDTITVKNGKYATTAALHVRCAGTKEAPITIAAESVGGVEIGGSHGFDVAAPAAQVVIRGFLLTHASGRNTIGAGTSHVRFTRNTFVCTGTGAYLTVMGDDAEVDHNEFRDKKTLGNMISVTGTAPAVQSASAPPMAVGSVAQVARRLWIHHNYFHDFANARGNGAETIRFGLSWLSMSNGEGLVEHNLFVRCVGENELISNKSCGNTYRYNTFLDSRGAQLTIRHGNDCTVYGNYFRGTDGLRIFGDRHLVHSNYLEGNTRGINLGNGDGEVADGAKLTSHDRPDHCVIAFNTLVNNRQQYQMDERERNGMGATHTTFAYNIILGGEAAVKIGGTNPDAVWAGNLVWNSGDPKDLPPTGFTSVDPMLAADSHGIYRPQKNSPALKTVDALAKIAVDFEGQPRGARTVIGADEPSSAPVAARVLTPADVGPQAP